jgi:hypothetical protein
MTQTNLGTKLSVSALVSAALIFGAAMEAKAAGFSGNYAPSNWSLTNANTNGFVNTTAAPGSITLVGGDGGGSGSGSTLYKIAAPSTGSISFNWNYGTNDWSAGYDPFGFSLNGNFTTLTNSGLKSQSGSYTTTLNSGDIFGFQVNTVDNVVGAGYVTISEFNAPKAVPVPAVIPGLLLAGAFGALKVRKQKSAAK